MSIALTPAEIDKLRTKLERVCDELQEYGASSVLVAFTHSEKNEDGTIGHNCSFRRHGNYFEVVGLVESVRLTLREDHSPKDVV